MGNATTWKPGQSGNPSGRRPVIQSFAELVRQKTGKGAALVDFMLEVQSGRVEGATVAQRIEANEWLRQNGFGDKPTEAFDDEGNALSTDQLGKLLRLSTKED